MPVLWVPYTSYLYLYALVFACLGYTSWLNVSGEGLVRSFFGCDISLSLAYGLSPLLRVCFLTLFISCFSMFSA